MSIYITLLLIFLFGAILTSVQKDKKHMYGLFLMFCMFFVSAFRYDVGMDYMSYDEIYNFMNVEGEDIRVEWGFSTICELSRFFGGTSQFMFLIVSFITLFFFYKAYRYFSPDIVMSLGIFMCMGQLYFNTFNAVRQCVAVAIFAYSLRYILNKNMFKYMLSIFVATMFHSTAVILFPMYFLLNRHYSAKVKLISMVILLFSGGIIMTIILNSPYAIYIKFDHYAQGVSYVNYLYLIFGLLIILFEKNIMQNYKDREVFLNINLICTGLYILYFVFANTPIVMVIGRINYYFVWFYAVIFVRMILDIKNIKYRLLSEFILYVILIALYMRTTLFLGDSYNLMPYEFNFNLFS